MQLITLLFFLRPFPFYLILPHFIEGTLVLLLSLIGQECYKQIITYTMSPLKGSQIATKIMG